MLSGRGAAQSSFAAAAGLPPHRMLAGAPLARRGPALLRLATRASSADTADAPAASSAAAAPPAADAAAPAPRAPHFDGRARSGDGGAAPAPRAPHFDGRARGGDGRAAPPPAPPSPEALTRNAALVERLRGKLILAPLTKGGNTPFRRLCAGFGMEASVGEMAFARELVKGRSGRELALLRRAPEERLFGVQIATNEIAEGVAAACIAAAAGADFVDLNCGCPIYEATRRGLGAALLRKPAKLARLVAGIIAQIDVPLTVKIRTGVGQDDVNADSLAAALGAAGAAAVTVHGRTMTQRYKRPADWAVIEGAARRAGAPPLIGNGDVLTHYEVARRMGGHGCLAVMVGRGALTKPWLFQEVRDGRAYEPDAADRIGIYRQLVSLMREHFGDDAQGFRKASYFLPFHLGWMSRYRPLPEAVFGELSLRQPLISTRWEGVAAPELGETLEGLGLLERALRCEAAPAHEAIAAALWEAASDAEAAAAVTRLAAERLGAWEEEIARGSRGREGDDRDRPGGKRGRDEGDAVQG
jgi:tRNA-dihydrouridine synthase 3